MKVFFLQYAAALGYLLSLSFASRIQRRDCAANDCIRELRGQGTIASSDCVSFLTHSTITITESLTLGSTISSTTTETTTVFLSTETITYTLPNIIYQGDYTAIVSTTIVTTLDPKVPATLFGRDGRIPTYVSACSDTEAYASACSCYGVTPTHTKTSTLTSYSAEPTLVIDTLITTMLTSAVQTDISLDFIATTQIYSITFHRTEVIQEGTFALWIEGGYFHGSFISTYPDAEKGSPLDTGIVMPSNPEGVFYGVDPTYFNISNGNLFHYDIELKSAPPYEGYYVATGDSNLILWEPFRDTRGPYPRLVCEVVDSALSCTGTDGSTNFWGCVNLGGEIIPSLGIWPPSVTDPYAYQDGCYPIPKIAVRYP